MAAAVCAWPALTEKPYFSNFKENFTLFMEKKTSPPAKPAAKPAQSTAPKKVKDGVAPAKVSRPKAPLSVSTTPAPRVALAKNTTTQGHDVNSNSGGGISRGGHSGAGNPATPTERFASGLSGAEQEASLANWIDTVLNPEEPDVYDVPVIMEAAGNPLTKCYRPVVKGTAITNASGFACVMLCLDAWVANPALVYDAPLMQFLGTTANGAPITYTNASYVGVNTPDYNIGTATAGVLQAVVPGGSFSGLVPNGNSQTAYRLVGAKLSIWVDSSNQVTQGKVSLVRVDSPEMAVKTASVTGPLPLVGVPYTTISGYDPAHVSTIELSLPNWPSSQEASIVALPLNETPYYMWNPIVGTAYANQTGCPSMCAIVSGAAPNQAIEWRITFVYAAQMPVSFEANPEDHMPGYMSSMGKVQETLYNLQLHGSTLTPSEKVGAMIDLSTAAAHGSHAIAQQAGLLTPWVGANNNNSEKNRAHKARRYAAAAANGLISTPLGTSLGGPATHKIEREVRREIADGKSEKSILRRIWDFARE